MSSPLEVSGGKVQSFLFGKAFAVNRNISDYLELYERDPQSSAQARVIIVDGSASELITKGVQLKNKPRLGIYINELLRRDAAAGYCPDTSIVEYDIINTTPGISPIVPMIRFKGDNVEVAGTALIDRDKMTGRLDTNETACLFLAMGKQKKSYLLFDLPKDLQSVKKKGLVFLRKLKTKSTLQFKDGEPTMAFDVRLDVLMEEYKWGNLLDQGYRDKLEQSLNESIKTCLDEVFKKLQEAKCDAFGIGDKIRAQYFDYWESIGELDGWKKIFKTMKASFNVDSKIVRFGEIQ
jgi:Ger(x)C family germination protein